MSFRHSITVILSHTMEIVNIYNIKFNIYSLIKIIKDSMKISH
ncbi:hypothetical protein FHR99_001475 [Litorivivens lipolytica]|uniref:Uncharacterized protein n=1 Tax=Litorivivens lipolytica TaxID=1524264 RepID=A0A7W4Z586_9GAMM|nr:hypothetical protein [Litorivivens lipolytica]